MHYLNIYLYVLYLLFIIISFSILLFLYINNRKIQKFFIDHYFKYSVISLFFAVLDGLQLIINNIDNYNTYILLKFNITYLVNIPLMLNYSYRPYICYYNYKKDFNNLNNKDNKNIIKTKIIIKRFIYFIISNSIIFVITINFFHIFYELNNFIFYPYFIFTILWILVLFPISILLIFKLNKNMRNEHIFTFCLIIFIIILYILSLYNIITDNQFFIKYWTTIINFLIYSSRLYIITIKIKELNLENDDLKNSCIENIDQIKYIEMYKFNV